MIFKYCNVLRLVVHNCIIVTNTSLNVRLLCCLFMILVIGTIYGSTPFMFRKASDIHVFQVKNDSTLYELYRMSDSLFAVKNYSNALKYALAVIDGADTNNNAKLISNTNYLIGRICYETNSYQKAIIYFKLSLQGYKENIEENDSVMNADVDFLKSNLEIGRSFQMLYESIYSKENDSLLRISIKDSIISYYGRITSSSNTSKEASLLKSRVYVNLSSMYLRKDLNNIDIAEKYLLKSIEINKTFGDQYQIALGYNSLSNIFFFKKEYEKSKEVLSSGLEVLKKIKGQKADEIRAILYLNTSFSMYMLKDYKAYEYQEKSWNLYDEIKDRENQQAIADIYASRNYDKGMREGILQQEIKRQRAQNITWVVGIGSCFVIVSLILILKQYQLRQKYLSLELSQQELEQQQHIEKLKNEAQIRILNATLDGKESERKQIAETLHDSVSTMLSSAHLHLEACKSQFNGSTPVEVDKSQTIIDEAAKKIRDLSHTLVSSILLKFGLEFAIKDIAEKFSNSELTIDHDARYMRRYDLGFEIKLYNIAQEFLNNVLKHSKAKAAKIVLVEKNRKVVLVVEDNGRGFEEKNTQQKDGIGISQIKARIQMMGGKLDIESKSGKGTKVTVQLPIVERVVMNV